MIICHFDSLFYALNHFLNESKFIFPPIKLNNEIFDLNIIRSMHKKDNNNSSLHLTLHPFPNNHKRWNWKFGNAVKKKGGKKLYKDSKKMGNTRFNKLLCFAWLCWWVSFHHSPVTVSIIVQILEFSMLSTKYIMFKWILNWGNCRNYIFLL